MKTLDPIHNGTPPTPKYPDPPRSRAGQRLLDLADQPTRFPSDTFVGSECITKGEWERRHAITYGSDAA